MASFGMSVIRSAFGIADHLAPRLAGRAAIELFCRTPNAARPSAKERRVLADAAGFMQEARHHRLTTARGAVAVHDFRPPSGRYHQTVLVIHGWASRTEHMRALIEGLRSAGSRVLALDLPGHGQSSGRRLNMANAVEAVRIAADWFGPFDAVIGHSFGGAVAVNAAAGSVAGIRPIETERLVLISAPSSMPAVFQDFGRFLNLGARTQMAVAEMVKVIAGRPLEDYVGGIQLAEMDLHTLVIHAADDKEVSPDNARAFAEAGSHVRLVWANGLGHRRILGDPAVVVQAVDFALGASSGGASEPRPARVKRARS
jgi:pimeloyl-ACP methyl ester carboxylesterase